MKANKNTLNYIAIIILFLMQVTLWWFSNRIKPKFIVTPYPPTETEIKALSFGDKQFLYRKMTLTLQNAGDKLGHYTNMNDYDYNRFRTWFEALDNIDPHSKYIPFMAAYYYSIVKNEEKARMIAEYVVNYAKNNPQEDWRLLTTAAYIYYKQVKNSNKEIREIGEILTIQTGIPTWARTLTAFYLKDAGDICNAYKLVMNISQSDILTEKANTQDQFLINLLIENIERLKRFNPYELARCK